MSRIYDIYTDGGCRNTGNVKGGHVRASDKSAYAYLIIDTQNQKRIDGTAGFHHKTNNQMEVLGVIRALERLMSFVPKHTIFSQQFRLYSDSKYVDNAVNLGWLQKWENNHFQRRNGSHVKNASEWQVLARLLPFFPNLTFHWVKGHADTKGNIYVDTKLNHTMDKMK